MNNIIDLLNNFRANILQLGSLLESLEEIKENNQKKINIPEATKDSNITAISSNLTTTSPIDNTKVAIEYTKPLSENKLPLPKNESFPYIELSPKELNRLNITEKRLAPYNDYINQISAKYNIPVDLIKSVIIAESNGNMYATSPKGAGGLMQIMPSTARELGYNPKDVYDVYKNIEMGIKYYDKIRQWLGFSYEDYNNPDKLKYLLASYNAGIGRYKRMGDNVFKIKETKDYADSIYKYLGYYRRG